MALQTLTSGPTTSISSVDGAILLALISQGNVNPQTADTLKAADLLVKGAAVANNNP